MRLNRKSARRMIGQIVGKLVFPHGRPEPQLASQIVVDVARQASKVGRLDVLPKHINQIVNGSAELVAPAILNQVMVVLDQDVEFTSEVEWYHTVALENPRTRFVRRPVRRSHRARREMAHVMMRRG